MLTWRQHSKLLTQHSNIDCRNMCQHADLAPARMTAEATQDICCFYNCKHMLTWRQHA
jgi:hypothetical protein